MTVQDVYLDFETYNDVSVVDVGSWKYSEHPSCEVLCLAYSLDMGPIKLWTPDMPPPQDLIDAVEGGARFHAHNAAFEYGIWVNVLKWCDIPLDQIHCTMAIMASFSYPLSLDKGGDAIGADTKKDKDGKRLLKKFSMLQTSRKKADYGRQFRIMPEDDPEDFEKLCAYCVQDVATEIAMLKKLPRQTLPAGEHKVFELDFRMNRRGVKIDLPAVRNIQNMIGELVEEKEAEVEEITGGIRSSKRTQILSWAADNGYELDNYQGEYVKKMAFDPSVPEIIRRVLQIRVEMGKTSVTKYAKMIQTAGSGNKCRGMVQYCGAQRTGRFAGRLIQVHNLPRGNYKNTHHVAPFVSRLTLDDMKILYPDVMEAFSSMIRSMIIAETGHDLYVYDFSNIEGRVLVWMAGQIDVMEQFARGDDVYKHMAAVIFGIRYEDIGKDGIERFVGKQAVLGCGYGMGAPKFLDTCIGYGQDIGEELAQKTIKAYRQKNHKVKSAWYDVERAAKEAIRRPGVTTAVFKCRFRVEKGYLLIQLPSKRCLSYVAPKLVDDRITYMGVDQLTGKWVRQETYGGKLVENIVQAVARDLLVHAMLLVESKGYDMLTTVHDELVATRESGTGGSAEEFEKLMSDTPDWAEDCPVEAEGFVAKRYRK